MNARSRRDRARLRLVPPPGTPPVEYTLSFALPDGTLRDVVVEVNPTGDEGIDQADAIVTATLKLDDDGIKVWSFKGMARRAS